MNETILIENWEEKKDFDLRYEEYAKFFLAMKIKYISKKLSDSELISELTEHKNKVVYNFNKTLGSHFRNEIMRCGCTEELANQLIPENIFSDNTININALKTFRALEEKI